MVEEFKRGGRLRKRDPIDVTGELHSEATLRQAIRALPFLGSLSAVKPSQLQRSFCTVSLLITATHFPDLNVAMPAHAYY